MSLPKATAISGPVGLGQQRSFDELGTPLSEVTFCVLDIETTGGSPKADLITELGAVRIRGGEVLGRYSTMVNPGIAIPPNITVLTGITDQLVVRAPSIDRVLPTFLEFIGGAVIVGHNVRFDMGFIEMANRRWGGPLLGNQRLDTLALARRLLQGEVPRFSLGELAQRLRLPHQPSHRALADAEATVDLLHYLIERASSWGVTGLDDLIGLPTVAGHPQHSKLALTAGLPRSPGVYYFLGPNERVLYVGKATNLRSRVRSYFSTDKRRSTPQLLSETREIRFEPFDNSLEAELREIRLIRDHQPRFNRRGKRSTKPTYVRLTTREPFPRLMVTTDPCAEHVQLGPLSSRRVANEVIDAIHRALPVRRCSRRIRRGQLVPTNTECTSGQLGVAMCPCSGSVTESEYARIVDSVSRAMTDEPSLVLEPLEARMLELAAEERFEAAADVRDSATAFVSALRRRQLTRTMDSVEQLILTTAGGAIVELGPGPVVAGREPSGIEDVLCVTGWLDRNADRVSIQALTGELSCPLPGLPRYD